MSDKSQGPPVRATALAPLPSARAAREKAVNPAGLHEGSWAAGQPGSWSGGVEPSTRPLHRSSQSLGSLKPRPHSAAVRSTPDHFGISKAAHSKVLDPLPPSTTPKREAVVPVKLTETDVEVTAKCMEQFERTDAEFAAAEAWFLQQARKLNEEKPAALFPVEASSISVISDGPNGAAEASVGLAVTPLRDVSVTTVGLRGDPALPLSEAEQLPLFFGLSPTHPSIAIAAVPEKDLFAPEPCAAATAAVVAAALYPAIDGIAKFSSSSTTSSVELEGVSGRSASNACPGVITSAETETTAQQPTQDEGLPHIV
eukprot:RCo033403